MKDATPSDFENYDKNGFVIIENVLTADELETVRAALTPHMIKTGRNNFEGVKTNRVYALLAKDPLFAQLAINPLALAFAERDLGKSCLLSSCLSINLHPDETVQPWHTDDGHIFIPRPHHNFGVSIFWAIDAMTEENGATELLRGSHLWGDDMTPPNGLSDHDFATTDNSHYQPHHDPENIVRAIMPAGSMMAIKGGLWHRGGANRSGKSRLIITPQYGAGWARPLETMLLAVPPEKAARLPKRAQELLGYSIHGPFMGYVDGRHPAQKLG